jgi:hypothetical protein
VTVPDGLEFKLLSKNELQSATAQRISHLHGFVAIEDELLKSYMKETIFSLSGYFDQVPCHLLKAYETPMGMTDYLSNRAMYGYRVANECGLSEYDMEPIRSRVKGRWQLAAFLGSLFSGLDVCVNSFKVYAPNGQVWNPHTMSLRQWLHGNRQKVYRVVNLDSDLKESNNPYLTTYLFHKLTSQYSLNYLIVDGHMEFLNAIYQTILVGEQCSHRPMRSLINQVDNHFRLRAKYKARDSQSGISLSKSA